MAYKIGGKFVTKEKWEAHQQEQQDKAAMTDNAKQEENTMLAVEIKESKDIETEDFAMEYDDTDKETLDDTASLDAQCDALLAEMDAEFSLPADGPIWTSEIITIDELRKRAQAGKLNSAMAYQRKAGAGAWAKAPKQDALHDSILRGWYIMPFLHKANGNMHDILDSLQRTTTILNLVNGVYTPTELDKTHDGFYDYLNNRMFSLWPTEDQQKYLNMRIEIIHIKEDVPDEDIAEMFVRYNKGGVPLSKTQARRGKYADKLASLREAIRAKVWALDYTNAKEEKQRIHGKLSESGIEDIMIKVANTLYAETIDHDGDTVSNWFTKWNMTSKHITEMLDRVKGYNNLMRYITVQQDGYRVAKRIAKSSTIIPLLPLLNEAMQDEAFTGIYGFFTLPKDHAIAQEWKRLCGGGLTSAENINKRMAMLKDALNGK